MIDSLPYFDREYDDLKETVDDLVKAEMSQVSRAQKAQHDSYVNEKYPKDFFTASSPLIRSEFERIAAGKKLDVIDLDRYSLDIAGKESVRDLERISTAAAAHCGHLETRLMNLELLKKFGGNSWKLQNYLLEADIEQLRKDTAMNRLETAEINKKRKLDQTEAGNQLQAMEQKWAQLVNGKLQVEVANEMLEQQLLAASK